MARRHGVRIEEIDLWLLGGVARMRNEAKDPGSELRFALAGPAVTLTIIAAFGALHLALPRSTPPVVAALVAYQLLVNSMILGFNLLPAFPLDGGRVARSLLWLRSGDLLRATRTAAGIGRIFGYGFAALGGLGILAGDPSGLWLVLVGLFVVAAGRAEAVRAEIKVAFSGIEARELMSAPAVGIPADVSAAEAVAYYFARSAFTAFPVIDATGRVVGLLSMAAVEGTPAERRRKTTAGSIADRDSDLVVAEDADVATLIERPGFARVGRAAVVGADGSLLGLLSLTDIERALRARALAGTAGPRRTSGKRPELIERPARR